MSQPQPKDSLHVDQKRQVLLEKCLKEANMYQRKFRAVEMLSSKELLTAEEWRNKDFILLDARTAKERNVSMIRGAIPVAQCDDPSPNTNLVVYCTIGYRSGLEATRLMQRYPQCKVYNLDGLVAYSLQADADDIVNGNQEPAKVIHTFASPWNFVDPARFESTAFSLVALPLRFLQVGLKLVIRTSQTVGFKLNQCCCRGGGSHTAE